MPAAALQSSRASIFCLAILVAAACFPGALAQAPAPAPASAAHLTITGDVQKPLSLSLDDLKHMPRTTLKANNEHQNQQETYEGVALTTLLTQAGVPHGGQIRGAALATYILAEAADGYRVTFSLAELDPDFEDSEVMVADTLNGAPLPDQVGPLRLVVPHDKRPARWLRMLESIKVVNVPK